MISEVKNKSKIVNRCFQDKNGEWESTLTFDLRLSTFD